LPVTVAAPLLKESSSKLPAGALISLTPWVLFSDCQSAEVRPSAKWMLPLARASFSAVGLSNRWKTSVLMPGLPPQ
jgi:hypothetical protein